MKTKTVFMTVALLILVGLLATNISALPKISGWTDMLAITSTNQITVTTTPVKIVSSEVGGVVIINNEGSSMLRISLNPDTVLTDGFGIPAGAVVQFRFWNGKDYYVACADSTDISYIRGE